MAVFVIAFAFETNDDDILSFVLEHRIYSDLEKLMLDDDDDDKGGVVVVAPKPHQSKALMKAPVVTWRSSPASIWEDQDKYEAEDDDAFANTFKDCFQWMNVLHRNFVALTLPNDSFGWGAKHDFIFDDFLLLLNILIEQYKAWKHYNQYQCQRGTYAPMMAWWGKSAEEMLSIFVNAVKFKEEAHFTVRFRDFTNITRNMCSIIGFLT